MTTVRTFDFGINVSRALLWQYSGAERLQALVANEQAWVDAHHAGFWSGWVRDVFDLRTANGFGLTIWAYILDLPLLVITPGSGDRDVFGFEAFGQNFDQPTSQFGADVSGGFGLTLEQRRLVLRLRYFQLTTRATVPEINRFLRELFGPGVYVADDLDMTMRYVFTYAPNPDVVFVLEQFDLLPRPAGVEATILINPANVFGFGPAFLNFDQAGFGAT